MSSGITKFLKCASGNTAMVLALAALPLMMAVGSAVDYARSVQAQTVLQAAVDSAALAGSSDLALSETKMKELIKAYLVANGVEDAVAEITAVDIKVAKNSGMIDVFVAGSINTSLMKLAGIPSITISAATEVMKGSKVLELALVLDNTGSMADEGKIGTLKIASNALVDDLMGTAGPRTGVKIAVVPFSRYVNVGVSNRNQFWIDVPPGKWNGCVGSRGGGLDTRIDTLDVHYPGLGAITCIDELVPLSANRTIVKKAIADMSTNDRTYIPGGILWGWNVLDSNEPIGEAMTASELELVGGTKVMVIMTDGMNTAVPDYPFHVNQDSAPLADSKTAELCKNVKASGIKVYTIAFKISAPKLIKMLSDCASEPAMAFDATDSTALFSAFGQITRKLASAHMSK